MVNKFSASPKGTAWGETTDGLSASSEGATRGRTADGLLKGKCALGPFL
jgi:hypothetical protein